MYKISLLSFLLMGFLLTATAQVKQVDDPAGRAPNVHVAHIPAVSPGDVASVYPQSANYWTGTLTSSAKTDTSEVRGWDTEDGWMVFDLSSLPSAALIQSVTLNGYVNATYYPYWSATPMGSVDPVNGTAADIWAAIQAGTASGTAYVYANESSTFSTGWHQWPCEAWTATDLQAALSQGWFAMGIASRDDYVSYYIVFDGWAEANPPYLDVEYIEPLAGDVGTVSIDVPGVVGVGTVSPQATVFNYSNVAETFDVTMTIGSYSSTKTVTSLASLTGTQVTFDDWNATVGDYSIDVCTNLAGDPNPTNDCLSQPVSVQDIVMVYAYNAYDPGGTSEGIVTFPENDPSGFTLVAPSTSADFICCGTVGDGGAWYGLQYNASSGFQPLYSMTPSGTMTMIGTTDVAPSINGMAWDPTTGNYYGISYSPNNLYTIDVATGSCTLIGASGSSELFISLACSPEGQLYAIDIVADNLVAIDKTTGAATVVGSLGVAANYAQDMGFDQNSGILYWAAYTTQGQWGTIDPTTGLFSLIGTMGSSGAEVCALNLPWQVVPVEMTSFNANVNEGNVVLNWTTATETNNKGFEVQRNAGSGFEAVGFVDGNGTTTESHSYSFVDNNVKSGSYTYRLKQIDFDGSTDFSKTVDVTVETPSVYTLAQNYPNPFNPTTQINFGLASDSKVTLKIFDVLGQEVMTLLNQNMTAGSHNLTLDASHLNSGVYLYKIEAKGVDGTNFTSVKKMILTK